MQEEGGVGCRRRGCVGDEGGGECGMEEEGVQHCQLQQVEHAVVLQVAGFVASQPGLSMVAGS